MSEEPNWTFTYAPPSFHRERMLIEPNQSVFTDGSRIGGKAGSKITTGMGIVELNPAGDVRIISCHGGTETDINAIEAKAILKYLMEFDRPDTHLKFIVDTNDVMTRIHKKTQNIFIECRTDNSLRIQGIITKIVDCLSKRTERTTFVHINSHRGNFGNNLADCAAKGATKLHNQYLEVECLQSCFEGLNFQNK